ncbi:MAG: helix-turn-helix domain-containing protein [Bacteroidales bacterium]|nr:helix-turn-helix domain-containing protein [Bacteroidales bacterium]
MEFVFEKIFVPQKHSFISRKLLMRKSSTKIHSHGNYELNYVVSGSGRRIIGNNISSYEPGDLVLVGRDIPHNWEVLDVKEGEKATCIVTHFFENIISSDFFNIPELYHVQQLLKNANKGIHFKGKYVKDVGERLERMVGLSGLEAYIELLKIFDILLQIKDFEYLSKTANYSATFNKDLDKINKVYEYVFENIESGISLDHAADIACMAPGSFCRYFKKKTKLPFMQYVKHIRIGIAAKMLAETDKQITQICFESGYNNLANFNHYFKKIMGKTPSEYRKSFI